MSESQKTDEPGNRQTGFLEAYREFAPYLTLGFQLAAAVIILFFIGDWLDARYHTSPLFSLIGVAIGTVGGLIKFIRSVIQVRKRNSTRSGPPHAHRSGG
jgi:F0F1-type ATP synthase assembly protein I